MKTKIFRDGESWVTIIQDDPHADAVRTTSYFVPTKGGYVCNAKTGKQVCLGLGARGPTLMATPKTLLAVIRREYKRGRRLIERLDK